MISNNKTHNEKLAAATDHGELKFVFSTTTPSHSKDEDDAFIREPRAECNPPL